MARFSFSDLESGDGGAAPCEFRESAKVAQDEFADSQLSQAGLPAWIEAVRNQRTTKNVLQVVEAFQKLVWTDAERAAISQVYIRRLEALAPYE